MAQHTSPLDNMRSIGQALESFNEPGSSSSGNLPGVGKVDVRVTGRDALEKNLLSKTLGRTISRSRTPSRLRLSLEDQERYEHVRAAFPKINVRSAEEKLALVAQQKMLEEYFPSSPRTFAEGREEVLRIWDLFKHNIESRRQSGANGPLPAPVKPNWERNRRLDQLNRYLPHVGYPCLSVSDLLSDGASREHPCKTAFEKMGYFVFSYEASEENMPPDKRDDLLCGALENGEFDDEDGATLLFFYALDKDGQEVENCVIWTEEERENYQAFHVGEIPSTWIAQPSDIREAFPFAGKAWWNISHLFIAPSTVAKMLHALEKMDSGGEAQLHIATYAKENGISPATDMDFDEVSNLIYTLHPEAVVAIYDPARLNAEGFADKVLEETEAPFILANNTGPNMPQCNRVEGVCFNLPPQISPEGVLDTSIYQRDVPCEETPERYLQDRDDLGKILLISFESLNVPKDFSGAALSDTQKNDIKASMSALRLAGIPIDPEVEQDFNDFVNRILSIYGSMPFMTNFVHAHYLNEKFSELPDGEEISASVELKRRTQRLFELDEDEPPYIIQYWSNKALCSAVVYSRNGQVEFTDSKGCSYPIAVLERIASKEGWRRGGAVSILKLKGNGLRSPESGVGKE